MLIFINYVLHQCPPLINAYQYLDLNIWKKDLTDLGSDPSISDR